MSDLLANDLNSAWVRQVELVDQFDARWREQGEAKIGDFLAQVEPASRLPLLQELIKVDLEYRWDKGDRPKLEDYAVDYPELGEPSKLPCDLIAEEIVVRQCHGDAPSDAELAARFPGRIDELNAAANTAISHSRS